MPRVHVACNENIGINLFAYLGNLYVGVSSAMTAIHDSRSSTRDP